MFEILRDFPDRDEPLSEKPTSFCPNNAVHSAAWTHILAASDYSLVKERLTFADDNFRHRRHFHTVSSKPSRTGEEG